ncbi:hypothetical protein SRB17_52210 [Streptomyces sp. RB17]|uniref:hypothetical protein n=1 Tax=Streptomyces sp. RB17 TaxID=2585197 RepID=UPI0012952AB7|nr:hypothetical protein [Streptomyces sp. RB17]MQY37217.1 hypothetical protein [Streptomyces sp. RB17]
MHPSPFDLPEPRFVTAGEHPLWDEAPAAVDRDMAATLPGQQPPRLVAYPGFEEDEEAERCYVAFADGYSHGNPLGRAGSAAGALRVVAEAAQDTVMERLWQAWPVCTLHGLGLHVTEDAGRPSWWCAGGSRPDDPAHVRAATGEMDTVHRPRRPNRKRRKAR